MFKALDTTVVLEPLFNIEESNIDLDEIIDDCSIQKTQHGYNASAYPNYSSLILLEIRIFSKNGRRQEFVYDESNVIFSPRYRIGKMRKIEVAVPPYIRIDKIIAKIEVEGTLRSSFGLTRLIESKGDENGILEFNYSDLQEELQGMKGKSGFFFYLIPIVEKKGRDNGPRHRISIHFLIYGYWYVCYIDWIFPAGHKHESTIKMKKFRADNHNCIRLLVDSRARRIHQEIINLKTNG